MEGRAINRRNYSATEVEDELHRSVVKRLIKLIEFRNGCDAFNGVLEVGEADNGPLHLSWQKASMKCLWVVDLDKISAVIRYMDQAGALVEYVP